jgi:hypothetical protein
VRRETMKITNHLDRSLDFNVGVKDGAVQTDHVGPRETKEVKVKPDDAYLLSLIGAQAITVESPTGDVKKAQEAAKGAVDITKDTGVRG